MHNPIYLDHNATTPVDPQVADAIEPYLRQHFFGNPSSNHVYGHRAHDAVEKARHQVASLIGAQHDEIIFTGCATEANNLGIRGVAEAMRIKGRHIITSSIEHPSVSAPLQLLKNNGWEITVLPVDKYGLVSVESVKNALRPDTILVTIMHANNEVGTIQPISEISDMVRPKGILLHTDAAQSVGKIPVSVDRLGVDLLTLAGHKFYATKGVAASLGSACHEESDKASGVLGAMGLSQQRAQGAVRFSIGVSTSIPDIEWAASTLVSALCECGLKSACHIPDKNKLMSNKQIYPH